MQGNGSEIGFSTCKGSGIPSEQAVSAATIVSTTNCRKQARKRVLVGLDNETRQG